MEEILHLNGADGSADLQAGLPGFLQGGPGDADPLGVQSHGHGHDAVPDGGRHGLDPQAVLSGLHDGLQFDHADAQLVQQLAQLDLFAEGQGGACLLHGHITDLDLLHFRFLLKKEVPEAISLRDESTKIRGTTLIAPGKGPLSDSNKSQPGNGGIRVPLLTKLSQDRLRNQTAQTIRTGSHRPPALWSIRKERVFPHCR